MHVFCDFDGTISIEDATDFVLSRLADPQWEAIEQEWKLGHIGSAECMQRQIALINADKATLDATLDEIAIDPAFPEFVVFCQSHGLNVSVISDGVDYFIHRILARHGLDRLTIVANHLVIKEGGSYELQEPYSAADCTSASGVCKCRVVEAGSEPRIYVGDGRSDFCVSKLPEMVFAKGSLATYCGQQAIPYVGYRDFFDVTFALNRLLDVAVAQPGRASPAFI